MTGKPAFFDTSVLVAASVDHHVHHLPAAARLARLRHGHAFCATYSIVEAYTTLTRPAAGYGIAPSVAFAILQRIEQTFTLVSLSASEMLKTVERSSQNDLRGASIYDALLIACARKIKAHRIYTYNRKHFQRIAPDLASVILEP